MDPSQRIVRVNRVLIWRKRRRLNVADAAQLLDLSLEEYEQLERGEAHVRSRGLHALENEAGIKLRDITRGARREQPNDVEDTESDDIA